MIYRLSQVPKQAIHTLEQIMNKLTGGPVATGRLSATGEVCNGGFQAATDSTAGSGKSSHLGRSGS
jgi:hypothetical protein